MVLTSSKPSSDVTVCVVRVTAYELVCSSNVAMSQAMGHHKWTSRCANLHSRATRLTSRPVEPNPCLHSKSIELSQQVRPTSQITLLAQLCNPSHLPIASRCAAAGPNHIVIGHHHR
ncbi:hypothetical protein V6N13_043094 [Hibiscus sabdariffa]|uniref:Uncharacterized protein n=1 Tax=Hibiscus sabdariffa TaxID=183260 RepID=A0ABR2G2M2_9ROSI